MVLIPLGPTSKEREQSSGAQEMTPPHLIEKVWLEFERDTALGVFDELEKTLERLSARSTAKRVHEARVALRRWDSVWAVLERDGWRTDKYWDKVGGKLKKLHKALGRLRDWDVNLEYAQQFKVPDDIVQEWKKERARVRNKVRERLKRLKVKKLLARLKEFVHMRPLELRSEVLSAHNVSAYYHLEPYLSRQERETTEIEKNARSAEELHQLRLSIKAWRYLLTDFFYLTNLQLVRAQQLLGKLNDLERILNLLHGETASSAPHSLKSVINKIEKQKDDHLKEFSTFRKELPYGLRPHIRSFSA